jgi:hypothetical protein
MEIIARGNKDNYFMGKTIADSVNPFETRYARRPGFVNEIRQTTPINAPNFGRVCEFEFDIAGDMFGEAALLIDLPSWFPPVETAMNYSGGAAPIRTPSGRAYGYTRGIGYFLFSKIQIFQDKILLQEFSGDALWASRLSRGSLNSAWLDQAITGMKNPYGTAAELAAQATPGRLRLALPMIGGTSGVPSAGMRSQAFRLKVVLRPLEECIECSDQSVVAPAPWNEPAFQVVPTATGAAPYTIRPLAREAIGAPSITLETRHTYFEAGSRAKLESMKHEIPYSVMYENETSFGGLDYKGATAAFTRDITAAHPASRMFWFLRTKDDLRRGRRWATSSPTGNPYYSSLSLIIAGRDRESSFTPLVWGSLVPFAKEDRDPGFSIGEMNWDLDTTPVRLEVPQGSINFTTAVKPNILINIVAPDVGQPFDSQAVEMTAVVESWTMFQIEEGRGYLKYAN